VIEERVEILLIEDNANDVELSLRVFSKNDLCKSVGVVRDGAEALDYIFCMGSHAERRAGSVPKVILLDLKIPKINGFEILRQLKANPRTMAIPVVVLSSSREDRDIAECYRLGANSYVVKPGDSAQFNDALHQLSRYWLLLNEQPPGGV
jgi:CheY-like chemotaxis protein